MGVGSNDSIAHRSIITTALIRKIKQKKKKKNHIRDFRAYLGLWLSLQVMSFILECENSLWFRINQMHRWEFIKKGTRQMVLAFFKIMKMSESEIQLIKLTYLNWCSDEMMEMIVWCFFLHSISFVASSKNGAFILSIRNKVDKWMISMEYRYTLNVSW